MTTTSSAPPEINGVLMQAFHWYTPADGGHWRRLEQLAPVLAQAGITRCGHPVARCACRIMIKMCDMPVKNFLDSCLANHRSISLGAGAAERQVRVAVGELLQGKGDCFKEGPTWEGSSR